MKAVCHGNVYYAAGRQRSGVGLALFVTSGPATVDSW